LGFSRQKAIESVRGVTSAEAAFAPGHGQWSVVEILEHLVLAEASGISKIWLAAEENRVEDPGANQGPSIEQIIERTWKEKEGAPPIATPHIGGPLACWVESLKACEPVLGALVSALEKLDCDCEKVSFPHFLCGNLNVRQRLEFLRFHIDRHVGQILRVKGCLPGR
jgi:hypothetical protein